MKSILETLVVAVAILAPPWALGQDTRQAPPDNSMSKPIVPTIDAPKPTAATAPSVKLAPEVVVTIDSETGRLRPATAAERAALSTATGRNALALTGEATVIETRPDGSSHVRLGPEFLRYSAVRLNPDGSLSFRCLPPSKLHSLKTASESTSRRLAVEK